MQRTNVWTPRGEAAGGGGGGVLNWAIGIDMYTLMCIKWMTNKNLLYKKRKKIQFKKKKKKQKAGTKVLYPREKAQTPTCTRTLHLTCGKDRRQGSGVDTWEEKMGLRKMKIIYGPDSVGEAGGKRGLCGAQGALRS